MKKILLVDDESIFRQGIRYLVDWENHHYKIAGEATNGKEALELMERLSPDIVLCDIVMPVMDGVELVRIISRRFPGVKTVVLSNYDEFSKVRQAFKYGASDYLLKSQISKLELLSCLDRLNLKDQENKCSPSVSLAGLAKQLLDGYAMEPFEAFDTLLSKQMGGQFFYMLYMERFEATENFNELFEELLKEYLCKYTYFSLTTNGNGCVVLINAQQTLPPYIVSALFQKLASLLPNCFCLLSNAFHREDSIKAVFDRLCALAKYSIFFDGQTCFGEADITPRPIKVSFSSELYYDYVRQYNLADAQAIVMSFMERVKAALSMDPFEFKKLIENIIYNTIGELKMTACDDAALDNIKLKLFKDIDKVYFYTDVKDVIRRTFTELELVCGKTAVKADQIISGIIEYISCNYNKPITLYDAALHLHINYSYLSNYISTNSSMHFSEHLNEIRILHAKRLLTTTGISISEISESIGYTDQSYFGKVFKKSTGHTPLEYRKKHRQRGNVHA